VFTPYWRAAREQLHHVVVEPAPKTLKSPDTLAAHSESLTAGACTPKPDWSKGFDDWTPGEAGALERLDDFLSGPVDGYGEKRDIPGVEATSRLSRTCTSARSARARSGSPPATPRRAGDAPAGEVEKFLSEVGWREFNHSILFHNPDLPKANFRPEFDGFGWVKDHAFFEAWTRARPAIRSSTPACASCGPPASCTTACG
jgi:deoxyribodipyrimidine photo-lyase